MIEKEIMVNISVILLFILCIMAFYSMMPRVISYLDIDLLKARTLHYRDNNTFF